METLHKRVAGIDVHRMKHVVTVLIEDDSGQTIKHQREYGGFKRDLKTAISAIGVKDILVLKW